MLSAVSVTTSWSTTTGAPDSAASIITVLNGIWWVWLCIVVTGTVCCLCQFIPYDRIPSEPPPWCSTSMCQSLVRNSRSQQSYTSVHASSKESSKALMLSIAIWHQDGSSNVGPFSPYSQSWLNIESRMFLPFFGSKA